MMQRNQLSASLKPSPAGARSARKEPRDGATGRFFAPAAQGAAGASLFEQLGLWLFCTVVKQIQCGTLELSLPSGEMRRFAGKRAGTSAVLQVHDYAFFMQVMLRSDIGFGEAYVQGQWSSPDPGAVLRIAIENEKIFASGLFNSQLRTLAATVGHWLRRNTRKGSRKNIHAHYDLGNEFFGLFLDPSLSYSAAYFRSPNEPLASAQQNKMHMLLEKAGAAQGGTLLEIGCGWGALALAAARYCRVTALTISEEQLRLCRVRIREAHLGERAAVELRDYRTIDGKYDRIVSVEMLEAVGAKYLEEFFRVCGRALNPCGKLVLQVICIPEQRYAAYRRRADWIQKYIFPGGHLPSLNALLNAAARSSNLVLEHAEDIGLHYAETLRRWRTALLERRAELRRMGFSGEFERMWLYYFLYCEEAFAARLLSDYQLVFRAPEG